MTASDSTKTPLLRWLTSDDFARFWRLLITLLLLLFIVLLVRQTFLRAVFPWDMYVWSESPFLTDMLKLDKGLPIYNSPGDANSFVYSAGLEYLTFAALKPFGAELDIRYCRLVNILIGLAASACGALTARRLGSACPELAMGWRGFLVAWAALALVLFKKFTADVPHPDNLHAFQALLVLYLCFAAAESKNFGLALIAMIVAGLGVLAKQTQVTCMAGPAVAFFVLKTWDRRRWLILVGVGALVTGVSLWWLWRPQYARFYTFELLSHQPRYLGRLVHLAADLLRRKLGALTFLSLLVIFFCWKRQGAVRRYLVCTVAVGLAAATLGTAAYIKEFGARNNLGVLEMFLAVLVWPFVWSFPRWLRTILPANSAKPPASVLLFGALGLALVILICPVKQVPPPSYYEYCNTIAQAVQKDLAAGRKVMVSHGTEFLIRAGDRQIPLDRANSYLELAAGKAANLTETQSRIRAHYYDKIYLIKDFGFDPPLVEVLHQNYQVIRVVPTYRIKPVRDYAEAGYQFNLMTDCEILARRDQ